MQIDTSGDDFFGLLLAELTSYPLSKSCDLD